MKAMNSNLTKEVALLGANTFFGKMTSVLLKQSPKLSKLLLYDDKEVNVRNDIEFINTACKVNFFNGKENISEAIKTADIIIIGDDCSQEMIHESVFLSRAPTVLSYIQHIASYNPNAFIVLATTPVNMTYPLAAKMLKTLGKWNEKKVIGMTNVENIRARCILANHLQISPRAIDFPVIGGSSSGTRVPLLSTMCPSLVFSKKDLQKITCAVKTSETKLHIATKDNGESLNRAYATSVLVESLISALNGEEVVQTVLSSQNVVKDINYFSLPVILGEEGIRKHIEFPKISQNEKHLLSYAIKCMAADVKIAEQYLEKTKDKLNILSQSNKLINLKWQKEKWSDKIKMPKLIPHGNEFTDPRLLSHKNRESKLHFKGEQKQCEPVKMDWNSSYTPKEGSTDLIFDNIHSKSAVPEGKLSVCSNEDIASEIDETLGVGKSHTKVEIGTSSLSAVIDSKVQQVPSSDSKIVAQSPTKQNLNSQTRIEGNIDISQDKKYHSLAKDKKEFNISGNQTVEPQVTIKDYSYSLTGTSSSVNKSTENLPTKSILEGSNSRLINGLENCKSLKRYHKEVASSFHMLAANKPQNYSYSVNAMGNLDDNNQVSFITQLDKVSNRSLSLTCELKQSLGTNALENNHNTTEKNSSSDLESDLSVPRESEFSLLNPIKEILKDSTEGCASYDELCVHSQKNILNGCNGICCKSSLQINKPHLMLQSELFKFDKYQHCKYPVTEWSRYASSESHDKHVSNFVSADDESNLESVTNSIQKHFKQQTGITKPNRDSLNDMKIFKKKSDIHQKNVNIKKSNDDSCFDILLSKQKNAIASAHKYSSFNQSNDQENSDLLRVPKIKSKYNTCDPLDKVNTKIISSEFPSKQLEDCKDKKNTNIKPKKSVEVAIPKEICQENQHKISNQDQKIGYRLTEDCNTIKNNKQQKHCNTIQMQINPESCEDSQIHYHNTGKDCINAYRMTSRSMNEVDRKSFTVIKKKDLSDTRENIMGEKLPNVENSQFDLAEIPSKSSCQDSCNIYGNQLSNPCLNSETNYEKVKNENESCRIGNLKSKDDGSIENQ